MRAMFRYAALLALVLATPAMAQQPPGNTAAARQILERDWVLMNWALKFYDRDRNILLEAPEAQAAANEFRRMADVNNDGRFTPEEYRAAREFILARY